MALKPAQQPEPKHAQSCLQQIIQPASPIDAQPESRSMNNLGYSRRLSTRGDCIWNGGCVEILALAITAPLVGSLTIHGVTQDSGQPAEWVIPAQSAAGYYPAPGSRATGGAPLNYTLGDVADSGKAVIAFLPS